MAHVKAKLSKALFEYRQECKSKRAEYVKRAMLNQIRGLNQDKFKDITPKFSLRLRCTSEGLIGVVYSVRNSGYSVYAGQQQEPIWPIDPKSCAVAYFAGLELAERVVRKFKRDKVEVTGEYFCVDAVECLDGGITRTTSGYHVFSFLKGALDGGLPVSDYINCKQLDAEVLKEVEAAILVYPTIKKPEKQPPKELNRDSTSRSFPKKKEGRRR